MATLQLEPKTDGRVLPQPCPLEPVSVDKPGQARNGTQDTPGNLEVTAGLQHCRGEIPTVANPALGRHRCLSGQRDWEVTPTQQSRVFVLDKNGHPLMPCHPSRARQLLSRKCAVVVSRTPFVIRLKDRTINDSVVQPVEVKIDPGSKTTGIAVVAKQGDPPEEEIQTVVFLLEIAHKGDLVHKRMGQRAAYRRRRRSANLRYRKPRFDNRRRLKGWLPPSLNSRLDNTIGWIKRLARWCPIVSIGLELVRFDMQAMQNPKISSVEYQQGTLFGYEVREYLLEKWDRRCAYCDKADISLEIDHVIPESSGGTNRVSNLTLACHECNQKKNSQTIEQFLAKDPTRLARIKKQLKTPLKDAAAVNATRWALKTRLENLGNVVSCSSGGRTKYNRTRLGLPKTHALDAACVGEVHNIQNWQMPTLTAMATGRGTYQRSHVTKYGFPRGYLTRTKTINGFQTGDLVKAVVPKGKKAGTYIGRVAVRATGSFNIQPGTPGSSRRKNVIQGINYRYCTLIQRGTGYLLSYAEPCRLPPLAQQRSIPTEGTIG